jgi:hypothetical protein
MEEIHDRLNAAAGIVIRDRHNGEVSAMREVLYIEPGELVVRNSSVVRIDLVFCQTSESRQQFELRRLEIQPSIVAVVVCAAL